MAEAGETDDADYRFESLVLSDVCLALADGTAEEKILALEGLKAFDFTRDGDDDEAIRQTIVIMTSGLNDPDDEVRAAAFDVLLGLSVPARRALSLQALGNDDPEIKLALLELVATPKCEFDLTYNFQALDADESDVRALAAENLTQLLGRTFQTTEEAFAWWETDPEARNVAASFEE